MCSIKIIKGRDIADFDKKLEEVLSQGVYCVPGELRSHTLKIQAVINFT